MDSERITLTDWGINLPEREDETGGGPEGPVKLTGYSLKLNGISRGRRLRTPPIREITVESDGYAAAAEDGTVFFLPYLSCRKDHYMVYPSAREQWNELINSLPTSTMKMFACLWLESVPVYAGDLDEEIRQKTEAWIRRHGLTGIEAEQVRSIQSVIDQNTARAREHWEEAVRTDQHGSLTYQNPSFFHLILDADQEYGLVGVSTVKTGCAKREYYEDWNRFLVQMESGNKPVVSVRGRWEAWDSNSGIRLCFCCRPESYGHITVLEAFWQHDIRRTVYQEFPHIEKWERFGTLDDMQVKNRGNVPITLSGLGEDMVIGAGGEARIPLEQKKLVKL